MKTKLFNRVALWLAFFMASFVASCGGSGDSPASPGNEDPTQVVFTLALDGIAGSRAPAQWEPGTYPPDFIGTAFDNKVVPEQLQVLFYAWNPSTNQYEFTAEVQRLMWFQTATVNVYEFVGELPNVSFTQGRLQGKLVVLANNQAALKVPASQPLEKLDLQSFQLDLTTPAPHVSAIPMWGVKKVDALIQPGVRLDVGVIYLLRSMAKVEVCLANHLQGQYTLDKVVMDSCCLEGYNVPWEFDRVDCTSRLGLTGVFRPFQPTGSSVVSQPVPFKQEGKSFVGYFPECRNGKDAKGGSLLKMELSLRNSQNTVVPLPSSVVEFMDFATQTPMDLVRNHYYRFEITFISDQQINWHFYVDSWKNETAGDITFN